MCSGACAADIVVAGAVVTAAEDCFGAPLLFPCGSPFTGFGAFCFGWRLRREVLFAGPFGGVNGWAVAAGGCGAVCSVVEAVTVAVG